MRIVGRAAGSATTKVVSAVVGKLARATSDAARRRLDRNSSEGSSPEANSPGGRKGATPAPDRKRVADRDRWEGPAGVHGGHTTGTFKAVLPTLAKIGPLGALTAPDRGWLRITMHDLLWHEETEQTTTDLESIFLPWNEVARVEYVPLGRRRAGLTITGPDDGQLWMYVVDRRGLTRVLENVAPDPIRP